MPKVSVVLPARDAASTLRRAIESIRCQTLADWELIVVDDGSKDGTRDVVREVAREDVRVQLVTQEPGGIVAALNTGLRASRGGLIARMDADDESHPRRLAEQVRWLEQKAELGLVSCRVEFGGDRAVHTGYALHVDWINTLLEPEQIALSRFVESPLAHPSVMFRRELVERHGGYRAGEFPEDYELWLRWLDAGVRMAKVPEILLRWNDSVGRLSRVDTRYSPETFFRTKAAWIGRWLQAREVPGKRDVWVWGAGRPTRRRAEHLSASGVRIAGYIDVDPKKLTRAIGGVGRPVIAPAALPPPGGPFVLVYVSSRGAREWIAGELRTRGYGEGDDFLLCA